MVTRAEDAEPSDDETAAVWEFCQNLETKPFRMKFFTNGSTDDGAKWELDPPRFDFQQYKGRLSNDGLRFKGKHGGGAHAAGRLLYQGILLTSEPATPAMLEAAQSAAAAATEKSGKPAKDAAKGKGADNRLIGPYELTGTSRLGRRIRVSAVFTPDGEVLDEDRRIANWERDKKLTLQFLDARIGEVVLTGRKPDNFEGKSKSDKDSWSWSVARVVPVVECKVDGGGFYSGTLTLYSNGRINSPTRTVECRGYWSQTGRALEFNNFFECQLSPDARSFTNNGGQAIQGVVTGGGFTK
jgi:hypothetical protein